MARSGWASAAPFAVAAYIGAAYFLTSSTSFANPAVTAGRMLTDPFTGIAPSSAPAFVVFQLAGGAAASASRLLYPDDERLAPALVVPHEPQTGARPVGC